MVLLKSRKYKKTKAGLTNVRANASFSSNAHLYHMFMFHLRFYRKRDRKATG